MGKKIGIVTLYTNNYGSCLQAFALYEKIRQLGYSPKLIKYQTNDETVKNRLNLLFKLPLTQFFSLIINRRRINKLKSAYNSFRKKKLEFTGETYSPSCDKSALEKKFDVFVCGSDMMWCEAFEKDWEHFFLRFTDKSKRIAYAPSFGVNRISEKNKERCKTYLLGFEPSRLSCRDLSGVKMIKNTFGMGSYHVVDPTMLYSKEDWNRIIGNNERLYAKPYVLLYLFGGYQGGRKDIIKQVKQWGIGEIKAIDIRSKYRFKNQNIGPMEYVRAFRDAEYVITDTFHGLMFSLIFEKAFVVLTRNDGTHWGNYSDRMTAQLDMLGISERYHDMNILLPDSFKQLNYSIIIPKIESLRKKSIEYLHTAIEEVLTQTET